MTRQSHQRGHVSGPFRTRRGLAYKIRYRVRQADGGWKQKSETHYVSGKKAARVILRRRLEALEDRSPEAADLTFAELVENQWTNYLDRRRVKPSTRAGYECSLRRHIMPRLGDMLLADIRPGHIERLVTQKGREGLSAQTQRNLLTLLQGIFAVAIDEDLIDKSPVRKRHRPLVEGHEKPVWSPGQVREIVEATPDAYRPLFITIALTGLRIGELLGLCWQDIDFAREMIHVRRNLWRGQIVRPKTQESVRRCPMDPPLPAELMKHLESSRHIGPEHFVFCHDDGRPLDPDVLRKDVLYPTLDRLGIPRPKRAAGFHAFRHTGASIVNDKTGNLKLTQGFLGHADLSTTADCYTHVFDESRRIASRALAQAIFPESVPNCSPNGD